MNNIGKIEGPTHERLAMGDVAMREDGEGYHSVVPTTLDLWRERGMLGEGQIAEERYSACEILFEIAQFTTYMKSNTVDYGRVPGSSLEPAGDGEAIDHVRYLLSRVSRDSSAIFRDLIVAPHMVESRINRSEIVIALDELIHAIEEWKESDLYKTLAD